MKHVIDHFKKLLTCEQFIITGSYALNQLGLTESVGDLDIILVNPDKTSIDVLNKLKEPTNNEYPSTEYFRVIMDNIKIDFYIRNKILPTIELANGLVISMPKDIVKAKKSYGRLKDTLQLMAISEIFYTPKDLEKAIENEKVKFIVDSFI